MLHPGGQNKTGRHGEQARNHEPALQSPIPSQSHFAKHLDFPAFFLINKDFFNGAVKQPCNPERQRDGGIVPPVFQRSDGLTADVQRVCQLFLIHAARFAEFFQSVFQTAPFFQKWKVNFTITE
jgi:hypothetical protein